MRYVGLDGCNTAKETAFLNAFVGYKKSVTRPWFRQKGFIPRFGWGFPKKKAVADYMNGSLIDSAFIYVVDFYSRLTHRNSSTGLFDYTYEQAVSFARHPEENGFPDPSLNNSKPEWNYWSITPLGPYLTFNTLEYVGCEDCYFDE
jgi:hypothetical protein